MSLTRAAVQQLYTKSIDRYVSFIGRFQSAQAIQALLRHSRLLRNGLRVLDAGCGFGMATFAVVNALRENGLDYESIDGFDLTPAMLERFQRELATRGISRVRLQQADVLAVEALPSSWTSYDLIISTSMLEYLPKHDLSQALAGLKALLAPDGNVLIVITRKTPETKVYIEWLWHAERYTRSELVRAFTEAGFRHGSLR